MLTKITETIWIDFDEITHTALHENTDGDKLPQVLSISLKSGNVTYFRQYDHILEALNAWYKDQFARQKSNQDILDNYSHDREFKEFPQITPTLSHDAEGRN